MIFYSKKEYFKSKGKRIFNYCFLLIYFIASFSVLTAQPLTSKLAERLHNLAKSRPLDVNYLKYTNTLRISNGKLISYLSFVESKETLFTKNGYFNPDSFLLSDYLTNKRFGDQSPYEYLTQSITTPVNLMEPNDNFTDSNASHYAEKVYLQLDGKVYTTGNIIWFKSIVLSARNHVPSSLSGVLYVELISSDKTILEKKLIKLENGIGQGFFNLDESYPQGTYLVRAYTNWNRNFGTAFFFEEYIQVFTDKERGKVKPINNIKLIKEGINENRLEANFHPLEVDSLHKNKLKILVTLDDKEDSLYIKKDKDNVYRLDYNLSGESQFVNLQMQTENNQIYAETMVLNEEYFDLQFLPESGELVHGLSSKVGFKALDARGKGKLIHGDIVDEQDSMIVTFKSNSLGMGCFLLNNPDSTKKYYARINTNTPENQSLMYPLPAVAPSGNILSVVKQGENILLTAQSNYLKNDSIYLTISSRGVSLYDIKAGLTYSGTFKLSIPSTRLPEGIVSFTMMDNARHPVAERIYFNEIPGSRININLTANKETYKKRELTQLTIETTDFDNRPLPANLSLLVINKKQMGKIQQQRQNILSYFLLDSELRGEIENPGFYFNKDSSMHRHLDALMLTQGWRKYNYSKKIENLNFLPETNLTLSGQVSSTLTKNRKKAAKMTLTTFGNNPTFDTQVADSLGNFSFDLKDEYGQKVNVLIQSAKSSGKKMNYTVRLNEKESPIVDFDIAKTVGELDSTVNLFVGKDIQRKKVENTFSLQSGAILLDEVEVTDYRLTPDREKHGNPDKVIKGESIQEKEQKWSFGLYSVLKFNFPDKLTIVRRSDGTLYAKAHNRMMTFVVIDGDPVLLHEYSLIPNIPPSEVASVEIIEYAKNFKDIFCKLYPQSCAYAPEEGNIIAIYTHGQKGLFGASKPVGMLHTSVPVFVAPREFYAPKYDTTQPNNLDNKPDLRALIHWEPELQTEDAGKTSASFYNADNVGRVMVIVEAISENGAIGYQEIEYDVEGKEIIIIDY